MSNLFTVIKALALKVLRQSFYDDDLLLCPGHHEDVPYLIAGCVATAIIAVLAQFGIVLIIPSVLLAFYAVVLFVGFPTAFSATASLWHRIRTTPQFGILR